eukprot:m.49785 g.49785  ORF g.49785 m.49785 type:complete len:191 (+) comp34030_c0_seq1:1686-2258(+)
MKTFIVLAFVYCIFSSVKSQNEFREDVFDQTVEPQTVDDSEDYYLDELLERPIMESIQEHATLAEKKALFQEIFRLLRLLNEEKGLGLNADLLKHIAYLAATGDPKCILCHGKRQNTVAAPDGVVDAIAVIRSGVSIFDIGTAAVDTSSVDQRGKRFVCGGLCIGAATVLGAAAGGAVYGWAKAQRWYPF